MAHPFICLMIRRTCGGLLLVSCCLVDEFVSATDAWAGDHDI
jgi:hypothetical protein